MKQNGTKNLTFTQRLQLEAYIKAGLHKKEIAQKLGCCLATVYNELKRGEYYHKITQYNRYFGDRNYKYVKHYSPNKAEEKYRQNMAMHGAPLKIGNDFEFVQYVEKRVLKDKLSPCAVLGEIKRNNNFATKISKTTLYRYIRMGIFMNIHMQDLPFGAKKKHYHKMVIKRLPKGTSIEKRPIEISKRNTFGHWEMDCVVGKQTTKTTLLVLTERLSRYEIIMRMNNRKSETVVNCINKLERKYGRRFRKLFKSITVDNGVEFSDYNKLERSIYRGKRTSIYYCHPYTSCERGTNERLNRDIRRLMPKGIDFANYSDIDIQSVENWINNYPREVLGFATSSEVFANYLSAI